MRKLILVGVLLLAFAVTGSAEGVKPVFYAGGGISLPMKPSAIDAYAPFEIGFNDMYNSGMNFGGGVGFQINPKFEVVGRVSYNSFSFDEAGFSQSVIDEFERLSGISGLFTFTTDVEGGKLELLEFMADVKFSIPIGGEAEVFKLFLLGGVGMTNYKRAASEMEVTVSLPPIIDTTFTERDDGQTETKLAFNLGAGFDWMVSSTVGIFADVRYAQMAVTGDPTGYLPIRGGLIVKLGQ